MNDPSYCPACGRMWRGANYAELTNAMWQCKSCHEIIDLRPQVIVRAPELAAALINEGHVAVK